MSTSIPMECSPVSVSPSLDRSGVQASESQFDAGNVTDTQVTAEHVTEEVGATVGSFNAPSISTTPSNATPSCATAEPAPVTNDESQEPPRRRYARRSSATMYNLHNYGETAQIEEGDNQNL